MTPESEKEQYILSTDMSNCDMSIFDNLQKDSELSRKLENGRYEICSELYSLFCDKRRKIL